jgi:hypothetical protein
LLDQTAMLDRSAAGVVAPLREHWADSWATAAPGSDPRRAARILAPIADARKAVIYRGFLDRIEPSERPYHRTDPATWLRRTAQHVRDEPRRGHAATFG